MEVKAERAAKLPVGTARAFLSKDALDRAPLEESELKEEVEVEPVMDPVAESKVESSRPRGQPRPETEFAVLSIAPPLREK